MWVSTDIEGRLGREDCPQMTQMDADQKPSKDQMLNHELNESHE